MKAKEALKLSSSRSYPKYMYEYCIRDIKHAALQGSYSTQVFLYGPKAVSTRVRLDIINLLELDGYRIIDTVFSLIIYWSAIK